MSLSDRRLEWAAVLLVVMSAAGCRPDGATSSSSPAKRPGSAGRRADQGEVLLDTVVKQLGELPSYVNTELQPPVVILDSTKSRDHKDVLAICTVPPNVEEGLVNYLFVPEGNSRFRGLNVQPGDIVKYYILYDEESLEEGIVQEVAMELKVAQVINDGALLVEGGLSRPVLEPAKMEVWRYTDDRLVDISRQLARYVEYRTPALGWEPSPDARVLGQIVDRLNQWLRQSQPKVDWQVEPLLETLDAELAADERLAPYLSAESLGRPLFDPNDGRLLQEAVWLRDVSRWAHGEGFDPVARGEALFDWTVRNIQLDADDDGEPHRPWQVIMQGHGTAEQRAWVFALLCRQQGLEVAVLNVPEQADSPNPSKFWLPALFADGEFYLFDTRLGLPIPGPGGQGVATLKQLQSDEGLLRQLDLDDTSYPVTAEQLQHITACLVADPFGLSRRAMAFEEQLTGDDQLALAANVGKLADQLRDMPGIVDVRLWDVPFRTLRRQLRLGKAARRREARAFEPFAWRPVLWKARVLHFQGRKQSVFDPRSPDLEEVVDDHAEAVGLYTSRQVRPPDRLIAGLPQSERRRVYATAKADASYWVGLLLFDEGKLAAAESWLSHPNLSAGVGESWADGTRYNLARTYEALGKNDEAIALYLQDTSPQREGNRLRARWLQDQADETTK